jgi:hypothetical protein
MAKEVCSEKVIKDAEDNFLKEQASFTTYNFSEFEKYIFRIGFIAGFKQGASKGGKNG